MMIDEQLLYNEQITSQEANSLYFLLTRAFLLPLAPAEGTTDPNRWLPVS